jgi:hypothetical protein
VQPDEQRDEGVDQAQGRLPAQGLAEQGAVGQGELQVPGHQAGLERLAVGVLPAGDHPGGLDRRGVEAVQVAEHPVFADGHVFGDLLDREDMTGQPHEADRVPGDTAGQCDEGVGGPVLQRHIPGQAQQIALGRDRDDPQWHDRSPPDSAARISGADPDAIPVDRRPPRLTGSCPIRPRRVDRCCLACSPYICARL